MKKIIFKFLSDNNIAFNYHDSPYFIKTFLYIFNYKDVLKLLSFIYKNYRSFYYKNMNSTYIIKNGKMAKSDKFADKFTIHCYEGTHEPKNYTIAIEF